MVRPENTRLINTNNNNNNNNDAKVGTPRIGTYPQKGAGSLRSRDET